MKFHLLAAAAILVASTASADPLNCSLTGYKAAPGLTAAVENQTLAVTWDGDNGAELRLRFTIEAGTPTIRELAVKKKGGQWATLASNVTPEFRVVSGMRRITQQQLRPDSIQALGGKVSDKVMEMYRKDDGGWIDQAVKEGQIKEADVERWKWEAFWDAPLYVEGSGVRPPTHATSIPPMNGIFGQKGLPRTPDEIKRSTASYKATTCEVKSSGARLEIMFPGVTAGVFAGRLQYNVFKGTNLIRQVVIAKTEQQSVAYKYDAGLKGLPIQAGVARRLARPGGAVAGTAVWRAGQQGSGHGVEQQSADRRRPRHGGSIAAFPPPHSFFGARESNQVLGDNYYRKDSDSSYSFGIRQAEKEEDPEFLHNFALTSARPGTWQQMPVFLYISAERGPAAVEPALTFTHGDTFKPLPGYQVMGSHYHVGMVSRLKEAGQPRRSPERRRVGQGDRHQHLRRHRRRTRRAMGAATRFSPRRPSTTTPRGVSRTRPSS